MNSIARIQTSTALLYENKGSKEAEAFVPKKENDSEHIPPREDAPIVRDTVDIGTGAGMVARMKQDFMDFLEQRFETQQQERAEFWKNLTTRGRIEETQKTPERKDEETIKTPEQAVVRSSAEKAPQTRSAEPQPSPAAREQPENSPAVRKSVQAYAKTDSFKPSSPAGKPSSSRIA